MPMVEEEKVRLILSELYQPPLFKLPSASLAHTRHFMPWDKQWSSIRDASRTMVFNTFVTVSKNDPVIVCWPDADLDKDHKTVLGALLRNISYLGRSESWCSMDLMEDGVKYSEESEKGASSFNVVPVEAESVEVDYESVSVLLPSKNLDRALPLNESHPLLVRTVTLREELGRIDPPGSVWVEYARPRDCFEPVVKPVFSAASETPAKVIRYLIDGNVLPRVLDTFTVASVARVAAMSVYGGSLEKKSDVLSGKNSEGKPLKGHGHAFYLPSDEDGDGRLDHLTLYAPMGFDGEHRAALGGLDRLYGYGLSGELRLMLLGMQEESDSSIGGGLFGSSDTWVSETPFLLTRYPKLTTGGRWRTIPAPSGLEIGTPERLGTYPTREHLLLDYGVLPDLSALQQDGPVAQLLLSCKRRGLPEVTGVVCVPEYRRSGFTSRWIEFKRYTRGVSKPVIGKGFGFEVRFKEPVSGPLALGYGCHYGLGLFRRGV